MIASSLSLLALAAGAAAAPVSFIETAVAAVQNTTQQAAAEWYMQNGNYGACGVLSKDTDKVAGLPLEFYSELGAVSKYCGNYIVVVNNQNNYTQTIRVEDASAANKTLSLSVASWRALDGDASGMKTVTWRFANSTESAAAAKAESESSSTVSNGGSSSWQSVANEQAPAPSSSSSSSAAPSSTWTPEAKPSSSSSSSSSPAWTPESKPSSTWTPPKSSSSSEAPKQTPQSQSYSSSSSSSGGNFQYSGTATWYTQNGNAGSCGNYNSDSSYIVAVPSSIMNGGMCGKSVTIKNNNSGKTITATIADTCPSCVDQGLDLSTGAFQALGDLGSGVMPISWGVN